MKKNICLFPCLYLCVGLFVTVCLCVVSICVFQGLCRCLRFVKVFFIYPFFL